MRSFLVNKLESRLALAGITTSAKSKILSAPLKSILSPEGRKRYFVVHGGLFSKDGVTLDEIRKIDRIGRQPGQEGLMCMSTWHVHRPTTDFS